MRKFRCACLVVALLVFVLGAVVPGAVLAEPMDKASLVAAWERAVLADPETKVLEKLAEGRYRFETTRFPYAGELVVLNASIDYAVGPDEYPMGVVEVELTDADDAFFERFAGSYGQWAQNSYLFYDQAGEQWLTSWQLGDVYGEACSATWHSRLLDGSLLWLLFLLFLLVFLLLLARRSRRHMRQALAGQSEALEGQRKALKDNEELLALARRNTTLQEEALDVLREISRKLGGGSGDKGA